MSKSHRGAGIRDKVKRGRSVCPICQRSGVKVIYEHEHNGKKLSTCKICRAALTNGKKTEILNKLAPAAAEPKEKKAETASA